MEGNIWSGGKGTPSTTTTSLSHSAELYPLPLSFGLHCMTGMGLRMSTLCNGVTVTLGPEMNTLHLKCTVGHGTNSFICYLTPASGILMLYIC